MVDLGGFFLDTNKHLNLDLGDPKLCESVKLCQTVLSTFLEKDNKPNERSSVSH